jgi:hypothetical protein
MDSREPNQRSQSYLENGQSQVNEEIYQDNSPSQYRWHPVRKVPIFANIPDIVSGTLYWMY